MIWTARAPQVVVWIASIFLGYQTGSRSADLMVEAWMEESRRAPAMRDLEPFSKDLEAEGGWKNHG